MEKLVLTYSLLAQSAVRWHFPRYWYFMRHFSVQVAVYFYIFISRKPNYEFIVFCVRCARQGGLTQLTWHFHRSTNIVYSCRMLTKSCGAREQVDKSLNTKCNWMEITLNFLKNNNDDSVGYQSPPALSLIFRRDAEFVNHYSPKWRWLVVDVYRAAKRRGKYPTLATDTEVNSCFSIY